MVMSKAEYFCISEITRDYSIYVRSKAFWEIYLGAILAYGIDSPGT